MLGMLSKVATATLLGAGTVPCGIGVAGFRIVSGERFPKKRLDPKNARTLVVDIQHLNEYQNRTPSGTQRVNKTNVYKCGMPGTCGSLPGAKTQRGRDCLHEKGVTDRLAMLDYINLLLCTH